MKKLLIITLSVFALFLISCKKKGVCTCTEDGATVKIYLEEMTPAEKRAMKRNCNGDAKGKIAKTETTYEGETITDDSPEQEDMDNCEWSRKGE